MVDCPICNNPENIAVTNKVLRGEMTISGMMEYFGVTDREVVEKHLKQHIRVLSKDDQVVAVEYDQVDAVGILSELTTRLKYISDKLYDTVEINGDILDTTNIRLMNGTIDQITKCLKTLGEFTGDISTGIKVELALQTNFMTKLQNFLLEELCETDKARYLEFLETNAE